MTFNCQDISVINSVLQDILQAIILRMRKQSVAGILFRGG